MSSSAVTWQLLGYGRGCRTGAGDTGRLQDNPQTSSDAISVSERSFYHCTSDAAAHVTAPPRWTGYISEESPFGLANASRDHARTRLPDSASPVPRGATRGFVHAGRVRQCFLQ